MTTQVLSLEARARPVVQPACRGNRWGMSESAQGGIVDEDVNATKGLHRLVHDLKV